MENTQFVVSILAYLGAARIFLSLKPSDSWRLALFATTNLALIWIVCSQTTGRRRATIFLLIYIGLVAIDYVGLKLFAKRKDWMPWIAFFLPIIALVLIKYIPVIAPTLFAGLGILKTIEFVGISYMSLRLSYLVLEVRNGNVQMPGFSEYLGFAFFVPTFVVGPINPYSVHHRSVSALDREVTPISRSLLRIVVGVTKYQVLAPLFNQLSYSGLLLDSHAHPPIDLMVAAASYYLYLYCNFAGFCDMAIGVAGLLGIHVRENFQNPLLARNMRDFWNRWHITLSTYMRDVVFNPLSKFLVSRGRIPANHAIPIAILVVFLLVGIWHGVGWNYVAFGAMHAVGVIANHYYTILLKRRGRASFQRYNESRLVHVVSISLTFIFVSASFFLFANDLESMRKILNVIRW